MNHATQYRYHGPLSSVSIQVEGQAVDVLLNPQRPVLLPAEHVFTQTLIAQQWLVAIPEAAAPAQTAPAAAAASAVKPKKGE